MVRKSVVAQLVSPQSWVLTDLEPTWAPAVAAY